MFKNRLLQLFAMAGFLLISCLWPAESVLSESYMLVAGEDANLLPVTVHRIILDPATKDPVVLLVDSLKQRALFIGIGFNEARAIYSEMQGIKFRRPLTHDLLENIIRRTNARLRHIVITKMQEEIYYATIEMKIGSSIEQIDARPSDSIVLALKFKAPIYVREKLFKELSLPLDKKPQIGEQYGVLLQDLTPSLAEYFSYHSTNGALVSEVRKGSQAQQDGIEAGDILVEIDDKKIKDVLSMKDVFKRGMSVKARIFRSARFITLTLHLE